MISEGQSFEEQLLYLARRKLFRHKEKQRSEPVVGADWCDGFGETLKHTCALLGHKAIGRA